jgi:hypothetical protein
MGGYGRNQTTWRTIERFRGIGRVQSQSVRTMRENPRRAFASGFQPARPQSKISLPRLQCEAADPGSVPILVHLRKCFLEQSDTLRITTRCRWSNRRTTLRRSAPSAKVIHFNLGAFTPIVRIDSDMSRANRPELLHSCKRTTVRQGQRQSSRTASRGRRGTPRTGGGERSHPGVTP